MSLNDYIQQNYLELKKITKNIAKNDDLSDDLLHHCILILLEYDEAKMNEIIAKNHVKYFYVSIVMKQWYSKTSPFYIIYKKHSYTSTEIMDFHDIIDEVYDHETDKKIDFIQNELKNESWYVQRVVELKATMSYGDINKLTKIPRSSLYGTFNQFRDKIINKYK